MNYKLQQNPGDCKNPVSKQGKNMLSVVIGNDIKDIEKLNTVINTLEQTKVSEQNQSVEEAIDWLKDIHTILTDRTFGQELYDPSEITD